MNIGSMYTFYSHNPDTGRKDEIVGEVVDVEEFDYAPGKVLATVAHTHGETCVWVDMQIGA